MSLLTEALAAKACYPRHRNWLYEFQSNIDHGPLLDRLSEMPLEIVTFIHYYKTEEITYIQLHFKTHKSRLYAECYLPGYSDLHVLVRPYSFWNRIKEEKKDGTEMKIGTPLDYTVHLKKRKTTDEPIVSD